MPRPRWRKALRDVWLHKARTVLVVAAIAIGIAGAGSVLNTYMILRQALSEGFLSTNPPSATLHTEKIDEELLDRVRALPAIDEVQARRVVSGRARVGGRWIPLRLFVMEDFGSLRIGLVEPQSGAWPPSDRGIVIEQSSLFLASFAGTGELDVSLADEAPRRLRIDGLARDSGLAPGWMEHLVYGYVTRTTLETLGVPADLDRLELVVAGDRLDKEAVRRIAFDAKRVIQKTGRRVHQVSVPEPGQHIHAGQMNSLLYTQAAFGLVALVLSGILVVNLISAILAGQIREIGVMKAIGGRTRQIAGIYLGLVMGLGLAASAVALPIAAWIGRSYAAFAGGMLNFDVSGYSVPLWLLGLELAVGVLLPVAAAALPVVKGSRVTVHQAVSDHGIGAGTAGVGVTDRILAGISGPARPLLLSLRNTFRRRGRLVLTLMTLAAGGAAFLGALNLRTSIRSTVGTLFDAIGYQVVVDFNGSHREELIQQAIEGVPGVASGEVWATGRAAVQYEDATHGNMFSVVAPPVGTRMIGFPVAAGRWFAPGDDHALVVNKPLEASEPRIRVGANVRLMVDGEVSSWRVVGIVVSLPGSPVAYAPRESWTSLAGGAGHGNRAVIEAGAGEADSLAKSGGPLAAALESAGLQVDSIRQVGQSRVVMEDHLLMVADFLLVMAILIVAVGGLGLATTMNLAVLERSREIGVMRAIGAAHGTILRIVVAEGLVIGALSCVVAVPLSIPMSILVGNAFGKIMFQAPIVFVPSLFGMGAWVAIVVAISVAASLLPGLKATRITTREALAYE